VFVKIWPIFRFFMGFQRFSIYFSAKNDVFSKNLADFIFLDGIPLFLGG
jgi:hypothetical protein